jgi:hypothetical protein
MVEFSGLCERNRYNTDGCEGFQELTAHSQKQVTASIVHHATRNCHFALVTIKEDFVGLELLNYLQK